MFLNKRSTMMSLKPFFLFSLFYLKSFHISDIRLILQDNKITKYVNKLHQNNNNNNKALFAVKKKKRHTFVYVSIHMVNFTPDQYLMRAGSHARPRTNTFIHLKCRVNNIHCNDCIETL